VIALLPETFTLNELQQAIATTLGIHADEMESSSNFRRRLQEFVHRGVLQETSAPRDAATVERAGRPPRHYRFDPVGWQRWLHEHRARGSRGARDEGGWSDAAIMNYSPASPPRRLEHDLAERARALASGPGRADEPSSTPDADERLARLERMMRAMEKRLDGGDAIP
jgi:predicted ArsR family transcriptional regulator